MIAKRWLFGSLFDLSKSCVNICGMSKYRYRILAMLFIATVINYMDRSIIGVLGPTLRDKVFHWTMEDFSKITISFQLAYAIGLLLMGQFVDRYGAKLGYAVSIAVWSIFNMSHALIRPSFGLIGFVLARFGLGLGESGNFPACAKAVTEWFPPRERALATGVTNASTNIGAILAPAIIPLIVGPNGEGWQGAFFVTSVCSLIWLIVWFKVYHRPEEHPRVNALEINHISEGALKEVNNKLPWHEVFKVKETWAFAIMKTTDAVWWFYVFWGGMFLADKFKLSISGLGLPLIAIYVLADIGGVTGGWFSGFLMKRNWSVNAARKLTLLICAFMVVPVAIVNGVNEPWLAVLILGLGAAGHQGWSVTIFTIVSDVFPKKAVSSVIGIGGMVGSLTSMAAFFTLGKMVKAGETGGYTIPLLIAGFWYLVTLAVAHQIMPRLLPAKLKSQN
jgi:ACS family hexuronate transporter-like MFS transporter